MKQIVETVDDSEYEEATDMRMWKTVGYCRELVDIDEEK